MSLEPGLERREEFTVEDRLLTDVGGTLGVKVLSTPGMIAVMERVMDVAAHAAAAGRAARRPAVGGDDQAGKGCASR